MATSALQEEYLVLAADVAATKGVAASAKEVLLRVAKDVRDLRAAAESGAGVTVQDLKNLEGALHTDVIDQLAEGIAADPDAPPAPAPQPEPVPQPEPAPPEPEPAPPVVEPDPTA